MWENLTLPLGKAPTWREWYDSELDTGTEATAVTDKTCHQLSAWVR